MLQGEPDLFSPHRLTRFDKRFGTGVGAATHELRLAAGAMGGLEDFYHGRLPPQPGSKTVPFVLTVSRRARFKITG